MAPQTIQLVMRTGPTPSKSFPLSKSEIIVGRDATCDIVINDPEISRRHARLSLQGDVYLLDDLGSTNGTFVDGQRLMGPHPLQPGDLILFGENVSMSYEAIPIDADATIMAGPGQPTTPPVPAPPPVTPPVQEPAPAFFTPPTPPPPAYPQPTPGPVEYQPAVEAPPKSNSTRNWILAGCGCLVLMVICLGLAYASTFTSVGCGLPVIGPMFTCP